MVRGKGVPEMKGGWSRFGSDILEVGVNGHRRVLQQTFARRFPSCHITLF